MSLATHGTCAHGHPTTKVLGRMTLTCGVFITDPRGPWVREWTPEECEACPPGEILATFIPHPAPSHEVPSAPTPVGPSSPEWEEHDHRTEADGRQTYALRRAARVPA